MFYSHAVFGLLLEIASTKIQCVPDFRSVVVSGDREGRVFVWAASSRPLANSALEVIAPSSGALGPVLSFSISPNEEHFIVMYRKTCRVSHFDYFLFLLIYKLYLSSIIYNHDTIVEPF